MKKLDFAIQGMFSDLNQRTHDAEFDRDFPENGSFRKREIKGRDYWYYDGYKLASQDKFSKYVGPVSREDITRRVENFGRIKTAYEERSHAVRALIGLRMPSVDQITGRLIGQFSKSGIFRLRAVLVGTVAFNTYPGLIGALPPRTFQTGDIDFAQDHGISISIGESIDPVIETLHAVDQTFRPLAHLNSPTSAATFENSRGFRVEFLVPNRGSDDNLGSLTKMPALGGAAAQPLRYLDYLIQDPVHSTVLFGAGVGVEVPQPERFAVHKLIVAINRRDIDKAQKDLAQSAFLIDVISENSPDLLALAWSNAWERGPNWRLDLARGLGRLDGNSREALKAAVTDNAALLGLGRSVLSFNPEASSEVPSPSEEIDGNLS